MADNKDQLVNSIFTLGRDLRKCLEKKASENTFPSMLQMHALMYIKDKKNPTMSEIADQFGVALPTATKLIERLANSNLIQRTSDKLDRRIIRMSLTEKGDRSFLKMKAKKYSQMKKILSLLPNSDIEQLQRIISELSQKLEKQNV